MANMPAAVATALKTLRCDEIPVPNPEPGKVLVRTTLASICGSDLHIVYMGFLTTEFPLPHGYPGHEGIGEVVDGGGTEFSQGERVLTVPTIFVSQTFSGYQLVEPRFLIKLPDGFPNAHMLMAQQLGTVIYGCKRLPSLEGKTVAVIGQGSVGLFHDFMLRRMGAARIIGIEPVAARLAAGTALGIDEAVDVTGEAATDAVLQLTDGLGADLVIEAVGSVETFNQTLKLVRPEGRIAAFGLPETRDMVPFDWTTFFLKRATMHTVVGAQEEPGLDSFRQAVDLIQTGQIDMAPFVTHQFPIGQVQEAFDLADSKGDGALKVSITF